MVSLARSNGNAPTGDQDYSKNPYAQQRYKLVKELELTSSAQFSNEETFDRWLEEIEMKARNLGVDLDQHVAPAVKSSLPHGLLIIIEPITSEQPSWNDLTIMIAKTLCTQRMGDDAAAERLRQEQERRQEQQRLQEQQRQERLQEQQRQERQRVRQQEQELLQEQQRRHQRQRRRFFRRQFFYADISDSSDSTDSADSTDSTDSAERQEQARQEHLQGQEWLQGQREKKRQNHDRQNRFRTCLKFHGAFPEFKMRVEDKRGVPLGIESRLSQTFHYLSFVFEKPQDWKGSHLKRFLGWLLKLDIDEEGMDSFINTFSSSTTDKNGKDISEKVQKITENFKKNKEIWLNLKRIFQGFPELSEMVNNGVKITGDEQAQFNEAYFLGVKERLKEITFGSTPIGYYEGLIGKLEVNDVVE